MSVAWYWPDWGACSDPPSESCSDAGCPVHGKEPDRCLVCNEEADQRCAGCGAPLCDDDAQVRDFDRYCPGGKCLL